MEEDFVATTLEVNPKQDCPFRDGYSGECSLIFTPCWFGQITTYVPEKCPLRERPVTVYLKNHKNKNVLNQLILNNTPF